MNITNIELSQYQPQKPNSIWFDSTPVSEVIMRVMNNGVYVMPTAWPAKEALKDYLTKEQADQLYSPNPSGDAYLTVSDAEEKYLTKTDASSTYARITDLPDLTPYITKKEVEDNYVSDNKLTESLNQVNESIAEKQNILTPGTGISILNDVISTTLDLSPYLTIDSAASTYQPKGDYLIPVDLKPYLTIEDAANTYQLKGEYLTSKDIDDVKEWAVDTFQPLGDYALKEDLDDYVLSSVLNSYYTKKESDARFQAAGDYVTSSYLIDNYLSVTQIAQEYQTKNAPDLLTSSKTVTGGINELKNLIDTINQDIESLDNTYLTRTLAEQTYLSIQNASDTYLSKSDASQTYQKILSEGEHISIQDNTVSVTDLPVIKQVTPDDDTVAASYELQDSTGKVYGARINILKDSTIKSVGYNEETKDLEFVFILNDGSEQNLNVPLDDLFNIYLPGAGISFTQNEDGSNTVNISNDALIKIQYSDSEVRRLETAKVPWAYDAQTQTAINIALEPKGKLLGHNIDKSEFYVLVNIGIYGTEGAYTYQTEIGNKHIHLNFNSPDVPTVEMPTGKDTVVLSSDLQPYQKIQDDSLETEAKTVPDAINELKTRIDNGGHVYVLNGMTTLKNKILNSEPVLHEDILTAIGNWNLMYEAIEQNYVLMDMTQTQGNVLQTLYDSTLIIDPYTVALIDDGARITVFNADNTLSMTVNTDNVCQPKTDESLETEDKTVVGAINEVNQNIKDTEEQLPHLFQIPVRTVSSTKVYPQEDIFRWLNVSDLIELKQLMVRHVSIINKWGLSLSGLPQYYRFPVEYVSLKSDNQIYLVFQGLDTSDDALVRYIVTMNLDGTLIDGTQSNVKVDSIPIEDKDMSEYQLKTDSSLITESKEITGAINELASKQQNSSTPVDISTLFLAEPRINEALYNELSSHVGDNMVMPDMWGGSSVGNIKPLCLKKDNNSLILTLITDNSLYRFILTSSTVNGKIMNLFEL